MKVSRQKEKQMERMVQFMVAHFGDIFREWNTMKASQFFALSGISQRNWSILMRHEGWLTEKSGRFVSLPRRKAFRISGFGSLSEVRETT